MTATEITAKIDPLRPDRLRSSEKLKQAGVEARYQNFEGVTNELFYLGPCGFSGRDPLAKPGLRSTSGREGSLASSGLPGLNSDPTTVRSSAERAAKGPLRIGVRKGLAIELATLRAMCSRQIYDLTGLFT